MFVDLYMCLPWMFTYKNQAILANEKKSVFFSPKNHIFSKQAVKIFFFISGKLMSDAYKIKNSMRLSSIPLACKVSNGKPNKTLNFFLE